VRFEEPTKLGYFLDGFRNIYYKQISIDDQQTIENEINENCGDILQSLKYDNFNRQDHPLFSNETFDENFILENSLTNLSSIINNSAKEYLSEHACECPSRLTIKQSWALLCRKNTYGDLHNHPNVVISGVYYHKVDQFSNKIRFHSPLQFNKAYNTNFLDIQPKNGMILLFPGWMGHEILPSINDTVRISISFGLTW
jgi:uncharacterized protein (TIGR02466 family)